nr:phage baseplate assembly protein V [Deinococcus sp. 6YEL10]
MPWSSDVYSGTVSETYWAPVLSGHPTYAGESSDFTPKVGTPVLVAFVGNDYNYPVVLGYFGNVDHEHLTGRSDLKLIRTRAGHTFIVDSEGKKKLKKLVVTSSVGHRLAMYDEDQEGETEDALMEHNGVKRQVYLKDFKGQKLTFHCPEKPDVPVYTKLENEAGTHILHMQSKPTRFASFSDIQGQFWKFDTDAQQFFLKGNTLVDIKSDEVIQVTAGTSMTLTAPVIGVNGMVSLGSAGGGRKVALDADSVIGTITDSRGGACSFTLTVKATAARVVGN